MQVTRSETPRLVGQKEMYIYVSVEGSSDFYMHMGQMELFHQMCISDFSLPGLAKAANSCFCLGF